MCESKHIIEVGEFIVIQRQNYKKVHKFNKANSCVTLGRDTIDLTGIAGCNYDSIFKMILKNNNKRNKIYHLELSDETTDIKDEIYVKACGKDNRNILDDGRSQRLTAEEIDELRNDSSKTSEIVETLISNSSTFHHKTEFSQEKYLRKKEKKYFEYIKVSRPNIRVVCEVMYRLDPTKVQNIRHDTLSQIITMSNIHSEGVHLLYDSGSNGLIAAALLNAIGPQTNGILIHMHPGNMSQKQALLALNFKKEQYNRCLSVNIYSSLRQFYQGCDTNDRDGDPRDEFTLKRKSTSTNGENKSKKIPKLDENVQIVNNDSYEINSDKEENCEQNQDIEVSDDTKPKLPKWHFDNVATAELLNKKVDSLIITSKEDPINIFNELSKFVKPGRPFVIYNIVSEPLQHLYLSMKSQSNVAALRLTTNWMRNYQVLPDRTHPEVMMNGSSGFLLSGYILK